MSRLEAEVSRILKQKGFLGQCHSLNELIRSVDVNRRYAINKIRLYKISGLSLLTIIPLLSTGVSTVIGFDINGKQFTPEHQHWLFALSVVLTICTIFNSILRPGIRFRDACVIGVGIEKFTTELLAGLEKMHHHQITEIRLADFAQKKDQEFGELQLSLIALAMPAEIVTPRNQWNVGRDAPAVLVSAEDGNGPNVPRQVIQHLDRRRGQLSPGGGQGGGHGRVR